MAAKQKPRYRVTIQPVDGKHIPVIHDHGQKPPKRVGESRTTWTQYEAERVADKLNFDADQDRTSAGRRLLALLGRGNSKLISIRKVGWNRRTGGPNSLVCFVAEGRHVRNVSADVSTILGWKWNDDDSIAAGNPHNVVEKLCHLLGLNDTLSFESV